METFELAALGFRHRITFDDAGVHVRSPGRDADLPWASLRGFAVTLGSGRYDRTNYLLIAYDAPGGPRRSVQLHLLDRASADLERMVAAVRGRDARLWHGEQRMASARFSLGLQSWRRGTVVGASLVLALLLTAVLIVVVASSSGPSKHRRADVAGSVESPSA